MKIGGVRLRCITINKQTISPHGIYPHWFPSEQLGRRTDGGEQGEVKLACSNMIFLPTTVPNACFGAQLGPSYAEKCEESEFEVKPDPKALKSQKKSREAEKSSGPKY